jgi:hypothetical protein
MAAKSQADDSGKQKPGRFAELRQDDLIEKLVPDPAIPPHAITMFGLVGKSNQAGYWRLYLTLQLNDYVEFSEKDVLHHQQVPPASNSLGGTFVWLRREANLLHTRTTTQQVQGQFFQGAITTAFLPQAAIESWFVRPYGFSTHVLCGLPHTLICQISMILDICYGSE